MIIYPSIILASSSPRRRDLLTQAGIPIAAIIAPDIDEQSHAKEKPMQLAQRLSLTKLQAVRSGHSDKPILAADTVVAKGRRILGKAETPTQAANYLRLLSGGRHKVITAIAIATANPDKIYSRIVVSQVRLKNLSQQEIKDYLDCEEWQGKAGAYAIQGRAAAFIAFISGSYSNIMGLPMFETCQLLQHIAHSSPAHRQNINSQKI